MPYYLTWDISGEYFWKTTPYRNKKTYCWEAEHTTPENKIPVKDGTLELFCWDCMNAGFPTTIYQLNAIEAQDVIKYATT